MATIEPQGTPPPFPTKPTGWAKFASSWAWLVEKICAPFKLLYTTVTSWHWKATKQGPDEAAEVARQVLQAAEDKHEEGETQALPPSLEQAPHSTVQAFTELLTTMKQAHVFMATADCPLPFSFQGRPYNVWINTRHGVTVESTNDPWFQLSISADRKHIYHKFSHEGTLKENQYSLPEGQDVLQQHMSIIEEATRAIKQAQNPNPTITPPFTVENGRELVQLLKEQKMSFSLPGGMTGRAWKNQYGGACIQIEGTGQRITLKDSGEMYYPETSPHSPGTNAALKKIIFDRSDMLSAALAEARKMALPPATPPPQLLATPQIEGVGSKKAPPMPLMPPPLSPPPELPPKVTPLFQPQEFSGITSCFPQSMQEEISLWGPQSASFDAEGQQFSASVEKGDQGTKIEFTNQQTREKISISLDQYNIVSDRSPRQRLSSTYHGTNL